MGLLIPNGARNFHEIADFVQTVPESCPSSDFDKKP